MWMTDYISEIKRQFRDVYKITTTSGTEKEPLFDNIPDGVYPMTINGKVDYISIAGESISCCNFTKPSDYIEKGCPFDEPQCFSVDTPSDIASACICGQSLTYCNGSDKCVRNLHLVSRGGILPSQLKDGEPEEDGLYVCLTQDVKKEYPALYMLITRREGITYYNPTHPILSHAKLPEAKSC